MRIVKSVKLNDIYILAETQTIDSQKKASRDAVVTGSMIERWHQSPQTSQLCLDPIVVMFSFEDTLKRFTRK
jgi:hypothetical protein